MFSPSRAAQACRERSALAPCAAIYAAFTVAYLLFFAFKPFDFPDATAPYARQAEGLAFWLKVMLWQPPLEAAWIVFLAGLAAWFASGRLAVRMALATAWAAAPFVLMAVYASSSMSKPPLAAGTLVWLGLFVPLWRRLKSAQFAPLLCLMLGLNVIGLAVLPGMIAAALARSPGLFQAVQAAGALWLLGCGGLGLRALTGLRLPRAFMALVLSMFFQVALAFSLHLLGVVPKDILKALLYA
ncbi:MAG: hypothetical protein PHF00_07820 [Elusimicrobia bacterium]|nr:hypothetical protein [Elusimicrobiota bacterium]